jgi:hypothetical protein
MSECTSYYTALMGSPHPYTTQPNLSSLYLTNQTPRSNPQDNPYTTDKDFLRPLVDQITVAELKNVVFAFPKDKVVGPDGFPIEFFQYFWDIIWEDLHRAVSAFYLCCELLSRRTHMEHYYGDGPQTNYSLPTLCIGFATTRASPDHNSIGCGEQTPHPESYSFSGCYYMTNSIQRKISKRKDGRKWHHVLSVLVTPRRQPTTCSPTVQRLPTLSYPS